MPQSVEAFLDGQQYSTLYHPRAYTASDEAVNARVPGSQWAKAVACFADGRPILAVLPACRRIDRRRLRALTGSRRVTFARERDFDRMFPDCEKGAVPPLGPIYGYAVFVDRSLGDQDAIVFSAGSHREAIKLRYDDFAAIVRPRVGEFAVPPRVMV